MKRVYGQRQPYQNYPQPSSPCEGRVKALLRSQRYCGRRQGDPEMGYGKTLAVSSILSTSLDSFHFLTPDFFTE
jgi:hypothetical protein